MNTKFRSVHSSTVLRFQNFRNTRYRSTFTPAIVPRIPMLSNSCHSLITSENLFLLFCPTASSSKAAFYKLKSSVL
ncbi:hypothetical protein L596_024228 [Steinernema carpocapsae]|uniref:Uncharacterized protein n=1 Tax=Steinernema carpocapsae TaxID=34508 RepID=A0A4U5MG50_STECR|nr:hypothetical protein L596_024228 [Steinernema carpocapsae]